METESSAFIHRQYAHCESGVSSNLIQHSGTPLSEAMAFGIGSGIFFAHIPFVKVMGLPLTSYRSFPTTIFRKCCKRLGLYYKHKNFSNSGTGQKYLDRLLDQNKAVALQTNIFWLPYVPERFRFPFNAHNIIVFGKSAEGEYLVSDPILEETASCPIEAMNKARFAKGVLAPKGFLYYIDRDLADKNIRVSDDQLRKAIFLGIKESVHRMLYTPFPFFGLRAINYLSKRIRKWHQANTARRFSLLLTHVIRMQEEIGTGGAGFRFLFAKFLEEASRCFPGEVYEKRSETLAQASRDFISIGDRWRQWACHAVRATKSPERIPTQELEALCAELEAIAVDERKVFSLLHFNFIKGLKL